MIAFSDHLDVRIIGADACDGTVLEWWSHGYSLYECIVCQCEFTNRDADLAEAYVIICVGQGYTIRGLCHDCTHPLLSGDPRTEALFRGRLLFNFWNSSTYH